MKYALIYDDTVVEVFYADSFDLIEAMFVPEITARIEEVEIHVEVGMIKTEWGFKTYTVDYELTDVVYPSPEWTI